MPRTMLNDQHWSKLESCGAMLLMRILIFISNEILEILLKLFFIELEQVAHGEIYHQILVIQIRYSKNIVVGLNTIS